MKLPPHEVIGNIVIALGRAKPAEPTPLPKIVAVGSLRPLKGYDCLIRAAGILARDGHRFELLLAGEGPERVRLETLRAELKLGHCVRFLGAVDDGATLMAGAHILAHPSKREGLSNTILEGMAEGLPVVATWECAAEIIEDGRTGLLVPAGQPEKLAAALQRLLLSPELRGELGAAACRHVTQHCNVETITDQYERVYRSISGQAALAPSDIRHSSVSCAAGGDR